MRRRAAPRLSVLVILAAVAAAPVARADLSPPAAHGAPPGQEPPVAARGAVGVAALPASQPAPASQPRRALVLRELQTPAWAARGGRLDLELRQAPVDDRPKLYRVRPFVELLTYHAVLTAAGWIYGNSPLDWDTPSWTKWKQRVTTAPVWNDGDHWMLNWGGHAVLGSDHYLMARNSGWSWYTSVAFNTFGSFFWEYVTEGIFEQPSGIDLVITPVLGSLLGEARYQLYRLVRKHWGRRWYAYVAMAVLDPTTTVFEACGWR